MLRFSRYAKQIVRGFLFKGRNLSSIVVANPQSARAMSVEGREESAGAVEIDHQTEDVKKFILSILDNYHTELPDGSRVAMLVVMADAPQFADVTSPDKYIGAEVRSKVDKASVFFVTGVEQGTQRSDIIVQLSKYEEGILTRKLIEPLGSFLSGYEPVG